MINYSQRQKEEIFLLDYYKISPEQKWQAFYKSAFGSGRTAAIAEKLDCSESLLKKPPAQTSKKRLMLLCLMAGITDESEINRILWSFGFQGLYVRLKDDAIIMAMLRLLNSDAMLKYPSERKKHLNDPLEMFSLIEDYFNEVVESEYQTYKRPTGNTITITSGYFQNVRLSTASDIRRIMEGDESYKRLIMESAPDFEEANRTVYDALDIYVHKVIGTTFDALNDIKCLQKYGRVGHQFTDHQKQTKVYDRVKLIAICLALFMDTFAINLMLERAKYAPLDRNVKEELILIHTLSLMENDDDYKWMFAGNNAGNDCSYSRLCKKVEAQFRSLPTLRCPAEFPYFIKYLITTGLGKEYADSFMKYFYSL